MKGATNSSVLCKDWPEEYLTPAGAQWEGRSRHHQLGKPAEGASFPTSTESSGWAAASLAPGGNPANYQTQTWDLHFYEMLTQEANLFPLKKKKKNQDG